MAINDWPDCPNCGTRLNLSKVENNKWVCKKGCNSIFETEDVVNDDLTYKRKKIYAKLGI